MFKRPTDRQIDFAADWWAGKFAACIRHRPDALERTSRFREGLREAMKSADQYEYARHYIHEGDQMVGMDLEFGTDYSAQYVLRYALEDAGFDSRSQLFLPFKTRMFICADGSILIAVLGFTAPEYRKTLLRPSAVPQETQET